MPPGTRKHFGTFDVDIETGELRRNGLKLQLQEKPFQMLAMLLAHPGEVVTREALRERLWAANTIVDFDHGLNTAIKKLRQALGDSADSPRFIETLARRGYRFIAPVTDVELPRAGSAVVAPPDRAPFIRRGLVAALGVAAVLVAIVAVIVMSRQHADMPARTGVVRLAVLPFENLGSTEDDYFVGGITDEVRGKLTNLPGLEVIARTSSNEYRKTQKKPQEIGEDLGAEYLLTGAVRFAKGVDGTRRVQVSSELSLAASGATRWAQPFDATLTDVFQVQGEIATRVAEALDVALSAGEKRGLEAKPTQNLPAYEAYLRGEEAMQSNTASDASSLRRAVGHYEQAVALDPRFMEAWAGVSRASSMFYTNGTPTPAGADRALRAAENAVALAPERPEGHQSLGYYYMLVVQDPARALPEMEGARRLSPRSVEYVTSLAITRQYLGQWEAALGELRTGPAPRSALTQYPSALGVCESPPAPPLRVSPGLRPRARARAHESGIPGAESHDVSRRGRSGDCSCSTEWCAKGGADGARGFRG